MMDRAGYFDAVRMLHKAFGELAVSIDDQVAENDRVTTRWSAVGTHNGEFAGIPPTGRTVDPGRHRHPPRRRRPSGRAVGAARPREHALAADVSAERRIATKRSPTAGSSPAAIDGTLRRAAAPDRGASGRGRRRAPARRGRTTGASSARMCASRCRCSRSSAASSAGAWSWSACSEPPGDRALVERSTSNSSTTSRAPGRRTSESRRSEPPSGTTWCSESIATAASKACGGASRSPARPAGPAPRVRVDRGDVVAALRSIAASSPSPAPTSSTRAGGGGSAART